jgi:lipopolysaccharide/colanic/teichoic acid biosynthesis glycosyltransferase
VGPADAARVGEGRSRRGERLASFRSIDLHAPPRSTAAWRFHRAVKRCVDIVVGLVALIVLAPLAVALALAIELDAPGPLFYRAMRVGYRGRSLALLKFRKMAIDATGLPVTLSRDERLTRVGGFLARTRLDEIPQFWQVVVGQLSLIGPRPEDPRFVVLHAEDYQTIVSVRPGITGSTQMVFADEARMLDCDDPVRRYTEDLLPQKVFLDRAYATNGRLTTDIKIAVWTPLVLLLPFSVRYESSQQRLRLVWDGRR